MARKLKVFRTSAGFNDAYVATTSRKAALAAWGADADLFARGIAEEVTDPELTKEPLAKPGEVIKRSRGGLAEQLEALGPKKSAAGKPKKTNKTGADRSALRGKAPSRSKVDKAEAAVEQARAKQSAALQKLEEERDEVDRRIAALKDKHARDLDKLERRRREAEQDYREALDAWSG